MEINDHNKEAVSLTNFTNLKVNPSYLLQLINKYVQLQLVKNTSITGFIHSIDPIEHSIIILEPREDKFRTTLIPGHAILDLCIKDPEANLIIPNKKSPKLDTENIARKKSILLWLKDNRVPASEVNDNIVINNVTILPPYNATDVCSENPILAMHISNLVDRMPKNYLPSYIDFNK